ncbi:MAG: ArsR family transcriptional regulator [Acidobacteria bacterium]|nr:ArsR family transcriptional regulator [Acidobacteriota bacterium]
MLVARSSPFGGQTRTRVLLALSLLFESYPRELARVLEVPLSGVQKALQGLEGDGIASGRSVGRMRLFRINPRYFAYSDLQRYLLRLTEPEIDLKRRVEALRRRPRRTGKPL